MKKKFSLLIVLLFVFVSIFHNIEVYASSNSESFEYQRVKRNAILENKVLSVELYNQITEKFERDGDFKAYMKALEKYDINNDNTQIMEFCSVPELGAKRIKTSKYYIHGVSTNNEFKVDDDSNISALDLILGFVGLIPNYVGVGCSVGSIVKTILGSAPTPESVGYKSITIRPKYDQVVTNKYVELHLGDNDWEPRAMTQKRVSDGYYVISGYKDDKHFSKTEGYGTIRTDVGKYFNERKKLLDLVEYGYSPFIKFDYLSGTTSYEN